jgi:hypothetical protein
MLLNARQQKPAPESSPEDSNLNRTMKLGKIYARTANGSF